MGLLSKEPVPSGLSVRVMMSPSGSLYCHEPAREGDSCAWTAALSPSKAITISRRQMFEFPAIARSFRAGEFRGGENKSQRIVKLWGQFGVVGGMHGRDA